MTGKLIREDAAPMISVTASKVVPVPPEAVWELVSDTARYAEYIEGTDEVSRTDGPAANGVAYDEVNPILGPWKARTSWTVIEFDAPHRQVHRSSDLPLTSRMDVIMEVAPEADGSRVTFTLEGDTSLGPVGALFGKLMRPQIEKDNRKSLDSFAELAIAEHARTTPQAAAPAA